MSIEILSQIFIDNQMSKKLSKHYDEFIETYERLFHLNHDDSFDEILNLIMTCLVDKYKLSITKLISTIILAAEYNFRSLSIYIELISQIKNKYPAKQEYIDKKCGNKIMYLKDINQMLHSGDAEYNIFNIIVYDRIDQFKEYVVQHSLESIHVDLPIFNANPIIDVCAYYGSVNIFSFLLSNFGQCVTIFSLTYAIIGGNDDIINECNKSFKMNYWCMQNAILSHNNKVIKYIIEHKLFYIDLSFSDCIKRSQNLYPLFLLYKKNKNYIIPWCAAIPQSINILRNDNLDFGKKSKNGMTLLHYAASSKNTEICKLLLDSPKIYQTDINQADNYGQTALHYAAKNNKKNIVTLLLSYGAIANARDKRGVSAYEIASFKGFKEIVDIFLFPPEPIRSEDYFTSFYFPICKLKLESLPGKCFIK